MENKPIIQTEIENLYEKLLTLTKKRGYFLNPDVDFTKRLIGALLINQQRYGYQACPCRLAVKNKEEDLDIICPCNYRDADVAEYGTCFCGLYVSKENLETRKPVKSIPERRPSKVERDRLKSLKTMEKENEKQEIGNLSHPVWRCDVCGYLCARDEAPDTCPICGVSKERFEKFI